MLSTALADGLDCGHLPPSGHIYAVRAYDLAELHHRPMTADDWLSELNPEAEIADLPARVREDLILHTTTWPSEYPALSTWHTGRRSWTMLSTASQAPLLQRSPSRLPHQLPILTSSSLTRLPDPVD